MKRFEVCKVCGKLSEVEATIFSDGIGFASKSLKLSCGHTLLVNREIYDGNILKDRFSKIKEGDKNDNGE